MLERSFGTAGQKFADIDVFCLGRFGSSHVEQLPDETPPGFQRVARISQVLVGWMLRWDRLCRELHAATDRHQDVVEVVRDTSRHATDRLHLLRLPEPSLDAFMRARPDIAMNSHDFKGLGKGYQVPAGEHAHRDEGVVDDDARVDDEPSVNERVAGACSDQMNQQIPDREHETQRKQRRHELREGQE